MTANTKMNQQLFTELAHIYGANFDKWPVQMQPAAKAFASTNESALRDVIASSSALDDWLDLAKTPVGDTQLLQSRIMATAARAPQYKGAANDQTLNRFKANWKAIAATFVASLGIGFTSGQFANAQAEYLVADSLASISLEDNADGVDWSYNLDINGGD